MRCWPAIEHRESGIDIGHIGIRIEDRAGRDVSRLFELSKASKNRHLFLTDQRVGDSPERVVTSFRELKRKSVLDTVVIAVQPIVGVKSCVE